MHVLNGEPLDKVDCFKGISNQKMAKSHVFLLMQISYLYIVWNNVPKFHGNRASCFRAMRQSMCVIVVSPKWEIPLRGRGRIN